MLLKTPHAPTHIKSSATDKVLVGFSYAVVLLFVLIVLYPLIYVISCSVSDPVAVGAGRVVLFPQDVTLIGYRRVFQDKSILTGYANTLFYTVAGTLINLLVTVPCGFSLAKNSLPGKRIFLFIFMFTMYFSGGMIPQFLLIRELGLYDTRWVLILLGAFNCYNCIICRTFFAAIPQELGEAASIDGCGTLQYFVQIVLPISQALLGVMVLYFAVGHWNSYFGALMYTSSAEL
ncbi:MAG: carbohydrate ABC transporter permease, partial [Peptococcaceae bacterium]|nr:carbohydrate ABC transporter permease [Peptococcaceae bacterium]